VVNLTNSEIKDADIDTIRNVMNDTAYMFKKVLTSDEIEQFIEEKHKILSLKFIKAPFLEKRVKGVTDIKEMIERVENNTSKAWTRGTLVSWICDNCVVEMLLLGENVHSELVKRCGDLVVFLIRNHALMVDMIDRIWEWNYGKHETTQIAISELFQQLCPFMGRFKWCYCY
jgi:hypothetical protein